MAQTEINYLGLRIIFKKNGKEENLDRLILHYIDSITCDFSRMESFPSIDFIQDVELQEETINRLTVMQTYLLIRLEAGQKDLLLAHLLQSEEAQIEFWALYEQNAVSIIGLFANIFKNMTLNEKIDFLYENDKYLALFNKAKEKIPKLQYFCSFDTESFKLGVLNFKAFIIKNGYPHLALAMNLIPSLYDRRIEIINGWVKEEKVLELDIYTLPLITGTISSSHDDNYIKELQKRGLISIKKPLAITPNSSDDDQ